MRPYIHEDFLLQNETARALYHGYAKDLPIYDYHCHLDPKEIWEDKRYRSITEVWLGGDHYKWRAMRMNGIPERLITGEAGDKEKFLAWAKTVPYTVGNPLYQWTHLELKRFFQIDRLLNEESAEEIWERANHLISSEDFSARGLIERSNVKLVCTTEDPTDSLAYHRKIREEGKMRAKVVTAFRPDRALGIRKPGFADWVGKLEEVCGYSFSTYGDFLNGLAERARFFHDEGCRISDAGIDTMFYREATQAEVENIFLKGIKGEPISLEEEEKYQTYTFLFLAEQYASLQWTMQLHIGAMRNTNARLFQMLGKDTGGDSIGDAPFANPLVRLLDALDRNGKLPKTILYNLNPADNYVLAAMTGNFYEEGMRPKVQFGSGWWFNDHKDGMERQMTDLANTGLLPLFVGMVTDSRSFLSYPRHEYFRRVLSNLLGEWAERGEIPQDLTLLGEIVRNISYYNAAGYFGIEV